MHKPDETLPEQPRLLPEQIAATLIEAGELLPERLRHDIIEMEAAAVAPLVVVLEDEGLASVDAPGEGWAPIQAAHLLGELRAADAIEPMLRMLAASDPLNIMYSALISSLSRMGAPVVDPTLRACDAAEDDGFLSSAADVLSSCGVHDERIFSLLLDVFETEPEAGAMYLAEYGDRRAIEPLSRAFDACEIPLGDNPFRNGVFIEIRAAIEALGGALTAQQEAKYRRALASTERERRELQRSLGIRAPARRLARPGRNDACWCDSGKKYKKCHLAVDEAGASEGFQG